MLSVLLALSTWMAFGLTAKSALSVPTAPEFTRYDEPEDGPMRLGAAELEVVEDSERMDAPVGEVDLSSVRDILVNAPMSSRWGWGVEVRSLVSQRIREGHGARGPPMA
jgi:hypothetical protein